jgi:hypothetical protein
MGVNQIDSAISVHSLYNVDSCIRVRVIDVLNSHFRSLSLVVCGVRHVENEKETMFDEIDSDNKSNGRPSSWMENGGSRSSSSSEVEAKRDGLRGRKKETVE